ncbi:universal stress protein [Maribacter sp. HTCC2170]|uniref:universal stress protein n=1 Tax=Maribacter sp. (strain HTCC2170 / KCCM 42371) TaxID=313603 RepID=UPI00006B218D|nr:universal stress protein [Maribacter sp. HTCC2170]EAR00079.1 putative universal stress protein UspA [Maribacter sp. HTCC2170]
MKTILIPTDFSENAWNTISFALQFLKNERCTFYFLHTYTPAFYRMDYVLGGPEFSAIADKGVDASLSGLEMTLQKVKANFNNPKHIYETVSAFNVLTDEITELSHSKSVDLIIMGTQGASGAKEIFLGTNTVHVIRKATVPILAIPAGFVYKRIEKILFAADYKSKYHRKELYTAIEIAKIFDALITVLHIKEEYELSKVQKENKDFLALCLAQIKFEFKEERGSYMPEAVIEYVEEHDFDILVMMNRNHSFFERILTKQNIDQIGFHIQVPFLVVPDNSNSSK